MIRILVAAEDGTSNWVARHVADLHLQTVEWVRDTGLEHVREWVGFDGESWLPVKRVRELSDHASPHSFFSVRGPFGGEQGAEDALAMRRLFLLARGRGGVDVLVVARDTDHKNRRQGFEQARAESPWEFGIAGAHAQPEAEAWLICSASAREPAQRDALHSVKKELGFDPITQSHRLTSTSSASKKDAKAVRQRLDAAGMDTESAFKTRSLDELCARGSENGLAAYIKDLDVALAARLGTGRS